MKSRATIFLTLISMLMLIFISVTNVFAYEPGEGGTIRDINSGLGKSSSPGFQVAGTSSAKVLGTSKGVSDIVFNDPYIPGSTMKVWAGSFYGTVDGETAYFFCIDLKHPLAVYKDSDPNYYTDNGPTSPQITYVLNNYYPYITYPYTGSLGTEAKEAAAIQLVIWHYADGLDLNSITNTELKNRAIQIQTITDANYNSFIPLETLIIIPPNQSVPVGTPGSFAVSTFDKNGNSLPNILVNLSATTGALSASSAVTDATGTTGSVTLTQGSSSSSVITALANVKIPQGTMYVHTIKPNEKQKLVLATPAGLTRQVTSNVDWYTPENCDTKGFTTFTQGGWGSKSNSGPGKIRDNYFSSVFPSGLVVGCGTYSITLNSAQAVEDYLPDGGTAAALTQNYTNPTVKINVLAGQVTALKLNVMYDEKGYLGTNSTNLGNLVFASGAFEGMSVYDFLALAENALGGCGLNGYTFSQINDAATAINENFDNGTVDNGYLTCDVPKASLGDKVWLDTDKDGIQDAGENGISGVTVSLYTCADVLVTTTTTDANGNYLFPNLKPGDYYVVFTLPSGYIFTTKDAGTDDAVDSDADATTGKTICTTLTAGENDLTWDAGLYLDCNYKIGDYVWHDSDVDGVQDEGETAIPGVKVELLQNGSVIASTLTDANGLYLFSDLCAGTYGVRVAASNYETGGVLESTSNVKWYVTKKDVGTDDKDSDALLNEIVYVTITNADNLTIDFGFFKTCIGITKSASPAVVKPGNQITYTFVVENCGDIVLAGGVDVKDPLLNPVAPYIIEHFTLNPGEVKTFSKTYTATVDNCGELVNTATAEGHPQDGSAYVTYQSSATVNVDCRVSIGDKVWLDTDKDGIQDEGESGVSGVTVNLYDCNNVFIATMTTDANGNYLFDKLNPGNYYVEFVLPTGYTFTLKDQGTDNALDSDADVTTGKAECTELTSAENDMTWDAGLVIVNDECDLTGFTTYTQGGWGSPSNSGPGTIRDTYFSTVFPGGLVIGCATGYSLTLNTADDVKNFLPQGGTAAVFTQNYTNPTNDINILAGQLVAAKLNIMFDAAGYIGTNSTNLGDLVFASGPFAGMTVNDFLALAEQAIGGCGLNGYTLAQFNEAATQINENFDNGTVNKGNLTCTYEETCVEDWSAYFTVEGAQNNAKAICKIEAGKVVVTGHVDLTPNPSKAFLQLAWRIVGPTDNGYDLTTHYQTIQINGSTDFTVEADWPGIKCDDQFVEVHVGVNVLDCDGNPIHNGTGFDYYWYPWVCDAPKCETADLELTKTADKVDAKNGDLVTYTITVKNNGSSDATGVAVKDVLPVGVEYQSSSTSLGSYDYNTGIWTIGNLASGTTATLSITVKVKVDQINNGTFDLGPATGFNLFILEDLNQPSSDTEGKVAVGGNATLGGYSVGDKLTPTDPPQDVLIVGGYLQYTSGRIYNGNVVVPSAASTNLPIYGVSIEEGELRFDTPINFPAASAYLTTLSTTLSNYVVNGTTVFEWGGLFLTGTNPFLNVFHVSGAELSIANNFEIDVPNGSVVVINVDGTTVAWMGGLVVKGTDKSNVIYNFYEASSLTIHGIDVRGTILAPFADLYYPAGVVNGQVIAKSMTGSGQFNNTLFLGNIPAETNIINIAEISAAAVYDPDSTPNNGISTEDDYGKAVITVKNDGSNKSESGNGGSTDVMSWESVGNLATATVLSFTNDKSGNVITGTSNGNIYLTKDNGANWEAVNTDTKTGAIWSLLRNEDGKLFAGTESGVYSSADNGKNWNESGLSLKDVRSIVSDASGNLFAGIWGEGVYQSNDNGKTWNAINAGLLNTAVQSLIVDDNDEVLAATYGAGVSRYSASEGIWSNTSVGNDYIWTLAKNSKGQVYAGTYGSGLYQLQNSGSWTKLDSGLPAEYIYSITFDSNDKVYVSSLANGVFASENDGTTWEALGMGGKGVSSIMADKTTNKVIAGTNDGNIYRSINNVTYVKNNNKEIPTEFKLAQNYPNPFNPSTTIEFAVAKREMVNLAVYDVLGQLVKVLVNGELEVGNYNVSLNASELTSGVYIYKLTTPSVSISKKMILQK